MAWDRRRGSGSEKGAKHSQSSGVEMVLSRAWSNFSSASTRRETFSRASFSLTSSSCAWHASKCCASRTRHAQPRSHLQLCVRFSLQSSQAIVHLQATYSGSRPCHARRVSQAQRSHKESTSLAVRGICRPPPFVFRRLLGCRHQHPGRNSTLAPQSTARTMAPRKLAGSAFNLLSSSAAAATARSAPSGVHGTAQHRQRYSTGSFSFTSWLAP